MSGVTKGFQPELLLPAELKNQLPEIIDNDKKVIQPDVLQAVTNLAILAQLIRIRKSLEKEEFEGETDPRTLSATESRSFLDLLHQHPHTPWVLAYFWNDGPNTVKIAVNNPWNEQSLESGEALSLNFLKADRRIEIIYYHCDTGETASVRVIGKY